MTSFQRGSAVTVTGGVRGAWPFAATLLLLVALGCSRSTQSGQRQGPESSTGSSPGSGSTAGTGSSTGSGAAASSGGGATASSSPATDPNCPAPTNNQGEFNTPNTLYYLGDTYSGPTVVALSGEDLIWT